MARLETVQSARDLVRQIAEDHGYVGEEILGTVTNQHARRVIEEALLKKDLMVGSSVITLAKNLYTSRARFVFELLQNADDNKFNKAAASRNVPYVSFRVYPRKIVLECNEDGFNHDNLVAICSVGKSSKTGAQGYIGEKGIGFKSVFMAAWKVHIQSGSFSFSFTHRSGDSGMGMITPVWEETEDHPPLSVSRITLHLHETGDADLLRNTREIIREQFEELEETTLLFMKNLQRINVSFHDEVGDERSSATYSIKRPQPSYAILERTKTISGADQTTQVKHFHVTTHEATNLAKNENRTYSESEEASLAYSKSQVTLAFPLSEDSIPVIEPQNVFVFLPVRAVGFKFLIQADFVTDASRQDIVADSIRNSGLIEGIADTFVKGVLQLCQHDTLRYQWMRYLPEKKSANWSGLWRALVNRIADKLTKAAVLFGQERADGRLIKDLVRLKNDILDKDGNPLFRDLEPEIIISRHYQNTDLDLLDDYGLGYANSRHVIEWLKDDLSNHSVPSRMRSSAMSDNWHTRVAKVLQKMADSVDHQKELRALNILPLEDGSWTNIPAGPVFLAQVGDLDIPSGIDMRLISKKVTDSHRLALFKTLGVKTASEAFVRERILDRYRTGATENISFQTSKEHLQFLYLTEHLRSNKEQSYGKAKLSVHDSNFEMHDPDRWEVYISNSDPCGARELFKKTDPGPNPGDGAPGHDAIFAHEDYFVNSPAKPEGQKLTWLEWFTEKLCVETRVRFDFPEPAYADIAKYLLEHRPDRFLSAVRALHQYCDGDIEQDFKQRLPTMDILCRSNRRVPLKDAYFPTEELESLVKRFVEPGAFYPWLWMNTDDIQNVAFSDWQKFLRDIGVGLPSTALDFALDMLKWSVDAFPDTASDQSRARLFELYDYIETKYRECQNKDDAKKRIRDAFATNKCLYIPLGVDRHTWSFSNECVWDAPQQMKTKNALRLLYEPLFRSDNRDSSYSTGFFTAILGIPNCTWEVYVEELQYFQSSDCGDRDTTANIYKALNELRPELFGLSESHLKDAFNDDALIYVPLEGGSAWHKVSQCVWSSAAKLRGRVSLDDDYEDLKDFFVEFLGVKMVDLGMAIDELKEAGARLSTSVQEMKESISTVNSLLPSNTSELPKHEQVAQSRIFPIRLPSGDCLIASTTTEFFIVDRENLRAPFQSKVKFLDFTLEEVVQLQPFFRWLHLEERYISQCVEELTSFHDGGEARLISDPNRQVRNRAHALLRIACHFNSPRTKTIRDAESFYKLLQGAEIFATDKISSDLLLVQDTVSHKVEGKKISLHIEDELTGPKIYLPRTKDARRYAFTTVLPQKLFEWMMRDPTTKGVGEINKDGINATKDIVVTSRATIGMVLDENGIAPTAITNVDEEIALELDSPSTPTGVADKFLGSSSSGQDDSDSDNLQTPATSVTSPSASRYRTGFSGRSGRYTSSSGYWNWYDKRAALSPSPTPTSQAQIDMQKYEALLGKVIAAARRAGFPSHGAFGMSQLLNSLPTVGATPDFGLRGASQIERDCIGAAGELYVFEMLSHMIGNRRLPGFSRENWQSTIREYVRVHPEYSDMTPWDGWETSDITYTDSESVLTELLIEKRYLARTDWAGKTPNYFIEVKTTTSSCSTPLYMSKWQYQRMQENTITTGNKDAIYVIFRVFNLGRDNMGVKVYLDPEALRLSGHLEFTAESWTVVPGLAI